MQNVSGYLDTEYIWYGNISRLHLGIYIMLMGISAGCIWGFTDSMVKEYKQAASGGEQEEMQDERMF